MSERYRIERERMGLHRYWLATGELSDAAFTVPDDSLDVAYARTRLVNVDFSGLAFASMLAYASVFEGCDFSNTAFSKVLLGATGYGGIEWNQRSRWPQTVYRDCLFRGVRFPTMNTFFGNARFERCLFDRARLRSMVFTHEAEFVDCTFRGKVSDVNFWGRPIEYQAELGRDHNEFHGNDFTGAELTWVAFNHIHLRAQRFPGLPDYAVLDRVGARVAAALAVIGTWPDRHIREQAEFHLGFLAENAEEYNRGEALISRAELAPKLPPDIRSRIFDLLVGYSDEQQ